MKLIKIIFASYYLFATVEILPKGDRREAALQDQITAAEISIKKLEYQLKQINLRLTMRSAVRTTKVTLIMIGMYEYANQIIQGPQDFTQLPELSTKDIKKRWQKIITTFENTRKSLELYTKDQTTPHAKTTDAVKLQGGGDNDRRD